MSGYAVMILAVILSGHPLLKTWLILVSHGIPPFV